ncbi:MAG: Ig-like domain repeat protein [Gemmatimonadetes bacterium]|nr:Ig-like domain repeat protein [Gemmatimonadota bacterium]
MALFRSPYRWLGPLVVLAAAVNCGGGDSLTVPSEGLPTAIVKVAGDAQSGTVTLPLADTLVVLVTDAKARPVQDQPIVFTRLAGGANGAVIPDTARTDINGRARSVWVLGALAGAQRVEARVVATGTPGTLKVFFDATAAAAAADTLRLAAGDRQAGTVGAALAESLAVLVTDRYGNPVAGQDVAWAVPAGQGSVSAALVASGADGRAAVRRTLGPNAGTQGTTATAAGLKGSPVSFQSTATAGGAVALVRISPDSQSAPAGFTLTDSVVVQVQDANGNGVAGRSVNWVTTAGNGSVVPQTSTTNAQGYAFTYWTLSPVAGPNTLTAAVSGLPQVTFTAIGGAAQPTTLAGRSAASQNGTVGQAVAAPPSVKVTDQNGNPVQGVTVTFSVAQGGGTVSDGTGSGPTASVATSAQGVATLAAWTLGTTAGANAVSAAATGAGGAPLGGSPVSFTATAAPGAAARLLVVTEPSGAAQSGVVFAQQPAVALRDAFGNAVAQAGVSVTATAPGGATLRGAPSASTNASGVATFSGLSLAGLIGSYTLVFAGAGLTPDTSAAVLLSAGPAALLGITTQPSATAQSGVAFAQQPVIQLRDSAGNAVAQAGVPVSVAIATGGGTLGGTTTVNTNASGAAAFTGLAITGAAGARTLTFSGSALASVTSTAITLGAGTPTALALSTQPSATAQSGSVLATQPVVELRDASNNVVALAGVSLTASLTGAPAGVILGGTLTVPTTAAGSAAFTGLSLTGPAGNYTLTFTVTAGATGVNPVTSSAIALAAGSGTALTLEVPPPATAQSGVPLSPAPVLQVRDGAGNAVPQAGVAVSVTIATGAGGVLAGTDTVLTNAAGVATFSNLQLVGPVGSYTLAFGATGLAGVTASPLTLAAGPAAQLVLQTQPATTAQSGVALTTQPVVQLQDGGGNPVAQAGVTVTASIASGGGSLGGTVQVATDAQGIATFTDLALSGTAGSRTLGFAASGLSGATSNAIALGAGAPASLAITAGNNQTATAGSPVAIDPQVQVTDLSGNPVAGVSVTFTVTGGGGTAAAVAQTDASGFAAVTWTLGGTAGANSLDASAALSGGTSTVSFTATGLAGSAGRLAMVTQPSASAQSGVVFAQQPVIQLQDLNGNNVTTSGVAITTQSSGSLGGNTVAFTVNGVATFTNLSLTGLAGSYQLTFTGTNITGVTSAPIALGAGAASKLVVVTQPSSPTPSGTPFVQQPVVQVQDAAGNPVASSGRSVTAAINGSVGSLNPAGRTVVTDAAGLATFQTLTVSGPAGSYSLLFSTTGLTPDVSANFDITAGGATQMTATSATSQSATVGTTVAAPPTVLVQDAQNNPVAGVTVTFQVTAGGGALNGGAAVTDNNGVAAVTSWTLGPVAGANTVTASASGLPTVTFNATGTAGAATQVVLTTQPSTSAANGAVFATQPVAQLRDANGNNVSQAGVPVTVAIASGGGTLGGTATVNTSASGQAAFSGLSITGTTGTRTLSFTSGTLTAATSGSITLTAGPATTLALSAGDGQSAPVGTPVTVPPAVLATDQSGNPVSGVAVTFAVAGGGGSVTGGSAASNASGVATVGSWTLGGVAGTNTLTATSGTLAGSPVTFTATGTTGAATKLAVIAAAPTTAQNGIAFTTVPVVQLQDASGNAVAQAGVTVDGALFSVTRTLTNGSALTDALGQATFTGMAINGLLGTDSLSFTSTGLTGTARTPLTVTAGTAVKLGVNRQPSTTGQSGVALATQPRAQVQDISGNSVSVTGVLVTATIASGPVGATVTNPTDTTGSTGLATFSGLAVSGPPGTYTLQFDATAAGYTPVVSGNLVLAVGPASQLSLTTPPPATVASGAAFVPAPVVQLRDGFGNPVLSPGIAITATVASGPGGSTLTNAVATTDAAGAATFTGLALSGTAGDYSLAFAGTGLATVTSGTVALTAGGGSKLAVTTQPSVTAVNGAVFGTQPVLQLQDAIGNPVNLAGVAVTVSVASGTATLGGTLSATTNGSGQASFTNLKLTGTAGAHTLLFAASGYTGITSGTITLTASAATTIALSAGNSQTATVNTAVTTAPAVLVTDQSGNPVGGVSVTFTVTAGSGSVGGGASSIVSTGATGLAAPANWVLGTIAGANTLSATASGLTGSPVSFTATGVAGAATQIASVTAASSSVASGVTFPQQPSVRLLDVFGNAVAQAGVPVDVAVQSGGAVLSGTTPVNTASTGIATFSGLALTGPAGPHTLVYSSAGLTSLVSGTITVTAGGSATGITQVNPAATVVGESYTVSVSVTGAGGTPTGTVSVSDGSVSCNATLAGGSGSCALASTAAGSKTITATYAGDANFLGSSGTASHTVSQASTSTTVTGSAPNPSTVGTPYTANFAVVVAAPGAGAPSGNVTVTDGLGGSCTTGAGAGSCQLTPTSVGAGSLVATYAGDANLLGSTSAAVVHTVSAIATTTTITGVAPGTIVVGQQVTVSFTVSGGATGTVSVSDGTVGCSATVAIGSCSYTPTTAGAKTVTASYPGDATHGASSDTDALQVDPFGVATQLQFLVQPSTVLVGDKISPAVEVRILDALGNLVTSATDAITITIGANPGGGTLGGTVTVSASGGIASFGDLTIDTAGTGYTLDASAGGLSGASSTGFDVQ